MIYRGIDGYIYSGTQRELDSIKKKEAEHAKLQRLEDKLDEVLKLLKQIIVE